jgi:single-stranded DNA-binding protein
MDENRVDIVGKVSRLGSLKYTPSGIALRDFTMAVPQKLLDKGSVGYFEAQIVGKTAEDQPESFRIGARLHLTGSLWSRTFFDRQGRKIVETKILVDTLVPLGPEQKEKS